MTTTARLADPVRGGTSKSPIARSTLVRKRHDDGISEPSSPSKRSKVTFDSDVEVRVVEEWEKPPVVIQEEVRRALQKHLLGDDSGYRRVKAIYTAKEEGHDEPSPSIIRSYTLALVNNVSSLDKTCSDLVQAVLYSDWLIQSGDYVELYLRFLANLATSQTVFLVDVFRMLVGNLTTSPLFSSPTLDEMITHHTRIYARTHKGLQYLLNLIPSASRVISSIVADAFPHESDSKRTCIVYVRNLLKMIEYAPELKADTLALITERLVKVDVRVQVDLEDLAEDVGEEIPQITDAAPESLQDSEDSDDESDIDEDEDPEAQRTKEIVRNVKKTDRLLDILFSFYDKSFSTDSVKSRTAVLDLLLSQFSTIILPTYRSRHTQFLLFHFVQQSTAYIEAFVGLCVSISFDRYRPAMIRQAAAAYLASFVARGVHVSSETVRDVWDYISSELARLYREHEPTCRGPDLTRYSTYYALVQALLYIFCFRWRDLTANSDDESDDGDLPRIYSQEHQWSAEEIQWRPGVKETLRLNLYSPQLNPLKVCSPVIVTEFARIAQYLGVILVEHRLASNKRLRLSHFAGSRGYSTPNRETALSSRKDEEHYHLDGYFPFDPYHLPRSKRWIREDYREWSGVPGLENKVADRSDSEEEDAEDSNAEEDTETDDLSE